jgi:multidrug efflux pump subunit AcrA (membrane-fusion protein)
MPPTAAGLETSAAVIGGSSASAVPLTAARPPEQPLPALAEPRVQLFRERVLQAYQRGERLTTALNATPPWTWAALACVASLVIGALVVCTFSKIAVVGRGPGVLRHTGGVHVLAAPFAGRVVRIHLQSGDVVRAGQPIVSIDSSELRSQLLQNEQRVNAASRELDRLRTTDELLFSDAQARMQDSIRLTEQRIHSQHDSAIELSKQRSAVFELSGQGFVSKSSAREIDERVRDLERARLALEQQQADLRVSWLNAARDHANQLERARIELDSALSARDALKLLLAQADIGAPADGHVEAVVAKPGEWIGAGMPVARLVPPGLPTQVVAFVPDRDRAFLQVGAAVRLEVAQLPSGEFGTLAGKLTRVANSFASPEEIVDGLGNQVSLQEASYRVEIALDHDPHTSRLLAKLRAGTLLTVRVALRERRIISLIFDPLRRYLE